MILHIVGVVCAAPSDCYEQSLQRERGVRDVLAQYKEYLLSADRFPPDSQRIFCFI